MSQDKKSLRIRYEYEQSPEIRVQYAHGVWGGINPQGEIELNFYTESDKLPPYSECVLATDGSLGHEITPNDENLKIITRRIHTKLIVNYFTAQAVLEWLQDKINTLEEEEEEGLFFDEGKTGLHQ